MERNINIIEDLDGKKIVVINDICFKNRRHINWKDVETYLKKYIGEFFEIIETSDVIYIGNDFADEYTGSTYTSKLKGTLAKAKANAAQGIPELIRIAENKRYKENLAKKHNMDAKNGWYRYDVRFALPVFDNENEILRYNIFHAEILCRYAADGNIYLYDIVNVKKKRSTPLEP